jgi:pimeloyl-ACP methyl ester carboxylesterase
MVARMKLRNVLVAAVLAIVAMPWIVGGEDRRLGDTTRRRLPGQFTKLKDGYTNFELQGPGDAPTVVFVHGISSPSYIWGEVPSLLRKAGYRTLVYDLYGRGWSERPWATYDLELFVRQLELLLRKLDIDESVHVVALSMGGIVASELTMRNPGQVRSLTLIDPAGFAVDEPPGAGILRVPLVGDWIMQVFGTQRLIEANRTLVHDKSLVPDLVQSYERQLVYAGYKRAMLSTLRNMPLADFRNRYAELDASAVPIQVFWGNQDEITPIRGADIAAKLLPRARVHRIEGAGHIPHYEKTAEVAPLLIRFLHESGDPTGLE